MSEQPEVVEEQLPELDIRTVVVLWGDGDIRPKITYSGCSVFEAQAFAQTAANRLMEACRLEMDMDDDPDDEDDDDDF